MEGSNIASVLSARRSGLVWRSQGECARSLALMFLVTLGGASFANASQTVSEALAGLPANATSIKLSGRGLVGTIPANISRFQNVSGIDLSNNSLSGVIPAELGGLKLLSALRLNSNNLTGSIPAELGLLGSQTPVGHEPGLHVLDLSNNELSGGIPEELTGIEGGYPGLTLNISHNKLSGLIPVGFGSMYALIFLDFSDNELTGPIPSDLGKQLSIDLSHNALSGSIPALAATDYLVNLDLSSNNLTGAIPSNLGDLIFLGNPDDGVNSFWGGFLNLSYNGLTGKIPPSFVNFTYAAILDVSHNELYGAFPSGFPINTIYADSNNGLVFSPDLNLSAVQTLSIPNLTQSTFPEAPNMSYLQIGVKQPPAQTSLDLSSVPATCQYVRWKRGALADIQFWKACSEGPGCIVDAIGVPVTLSRSTKRTICLGKASVFLAGEAPVVVTEKYKLSPGKPLVSSSYLVNSLGTYFLNDSKFLDKIDLGPGGVAFTGVSFTRVQQGNLCANPGAARVVAITWGVFGGLIAVSVGVWLLLPKPRAPSGAVENPGVSTSPSACASLTRVSLYLWGIVCAALVWLDLATDIVVLTEVWGAWPAPIILFSILSPYIISGFLVARYWVAFGSGWNLLTGVRVQWIWLFNATELLPTSNHPQPLSFGQTLFAILLCPFGTLAVGIQDVLTFLETLGLHLTWHGHDHILSYKLYFDLRVTLELFLRSLPQAILQSGLYILGNSRSTRFYIDKEIFLTSVCASLLSILFQVNMLGYESRQANNSIFKIALRRIHSANAGPSLCSPDIVIVDKDIGSQELLRM